MDTNRVLACLLILSLISVLTINLSAQQIEFTRQFGASGSGVKTFANSVAADNSGNVYVCGDTEGTLPGQASSGGRDGYLRKYDTDGNEIWTIQFGGALDDSSINVALDSSNNIYVCGYIQTGPVSGDAFIKKFDSDANEIWTKQFGVSSTMADSISIDNLGNIYVCGEIYGTFPGQTSYGNIDVFVRKCNSNGDGIWTRQFGTSEHDYAPEISLDSSGNIYVCGSTYGTMQGQIPAGDLDAFVTKYNSSGNRVWLRQFGTSSEDTADSVVVDSLGRIYVCGETRGALPGQTASGGYDAYMRNYNTSGVELWTQQFGTTVGDHVYDILCDNSDNIYLCGDTNGVLSGQVTSGRSDSYVRKYDINHNVLWIKQFGTSGDEYAYNITLDNSNNVYTCGLTYGTFPGETPVGSGNGYITKIAQMGYYIKGYVRDESSTGISGVTISLSGSILKSISSASNGYYEFLDLPIYGNYTVTPAKVSYVFDPVSVSTSDFSGNIEDFDFVGTLSSATYYIKGFLRDTNDAGISDVTMTLSGGVSGSTTTATDGSYQFLDLPVGGNYVIEPSNANYIFIPASIDIMALSNNLNNQNFTGKLPPKLKLDKTHLDFGEVEHRDSKLLSFKITNDGEMPLSGTVTSNKEWIIVSPTDFSGNYEIINVKVDNNILDRALGQHAGTVNVDSNGGYAEVTIEVIATCVLPKPNPYDPSKGNLTFFGDGIVPGLPGVPSVPSVPSGTTIRIYTLSGELIKTLKNVGHAEHFSLAKEIQWDGKNEEGKEVINGIYIYIYESLNEQGVGKFTVINK